jgi:hypothetical protein
VRRAETIYFLSIIVLGVFLRVYNIGHSLGAHPDERHIVMTTEKLWEQGMNPKSFAYGSFPFYLLWFLGSAWGNYDTYFYVGRLFLGLIGFPLSCLLLIYISRQVFRDVKPGIFASLFLAGNPFSIQLSRFFTVDPILLLAALFTLGALFYALEKPSWFRYSLVGLGFGLSLATKSSGLSLLVPIGVGILFVHAPWRRERFLYQTIGAVSCVGFVGLLTLFLAAPYQFLDFSTFIKHQREQISMVAGHWIPPYTVQYIGTKPVFYALEQMIFHTIGIEVSVLVLLGIIYSLFTKNIKALILILWIPALFIPSATQLVKFPRYLLPIYPILFLFAGLITYEILRRTGKVQYLLVCLIAFVGFVRGFAQFSVYLTPHSYEVASKWIFENIEPGAVIVSPHWDDRLPISLPGVEPKAYQYRELPIYETDNEEKRVKMEAILNSSDYVVFPTQRIPFSIKEDRYPDSAKLLKDLFNEELGFKLVYKYHFVPNFLGLNFDTLYADESLSVYDHPPVWIFKKRNSNHENEP